MGDLTGALREFAACKYVGVARLGRRAWVGLIYEGLFAERLRLCGPTLPTMTAARLAALRLWREHGKDEGT